jgi:hypothetical protein
MFVFKVPVVGFGTVLGTLAYILAVSYFRLPTLWLWGSFPVAFITALLSLLVYNWWTFRDL